MMETKKKLH